MVWGSRTLCSHPLPSARGAGSWVAAAAAQRGGVGPLCPRAERSGACVRALGVGGLGPRPSDCSLSCPRVLGRGSTTGWTSRASSSQAETFSSSGPQSCSQPMFLQKLLSQLLAVFPSSAHKSRCPAAPPRGAGDRASPDRGLRTELRAPARPPRLEARLSAEATPHPALLLGPEGDLRA